MKWNHWHQLPQTCQSRHPKFTTSSTAANKTPGTRMLGQYEVVQLSPEEINSHKYAEQLQNVVDHLKLNCTFIELINESVFSVFVISREKRPKGILLVLSNQVMCFAVIADESDLAMVLSFSLKRKLEEVFSWIMKIGSNVT